MTETPSVSCLVATDLSARSDRALIRAFRLSGRTGGRVTVLHVVEEDYPAHIANTLAMEAEGALKAQLRAMPEAEGVPWDVQVVRGHDYQAIIDAADRHEADLLLMGGRRTPKMRDLFLASTAQRVVRQATVPVLVVKRPYRGEYRTALAAVDGSPHSRAGVSFVLGLFPELTVTAFYASDDPAGGGGDAELTSQEEQKVRRPLDSVPGFDRHGDFRAVRGEAGEVAGVLNEAIGPDLMVCGTSKSGRSFFLGNDLPGWVMVNLEQDLLVMP